MVTDSVDAYVKHDTIMAEKVIAAEYDVDTATAEADTKVFLQKLKELGIIE